MEEEQKNQLTESKIIEQLQCLICFELPKQPQRTACCKQIICYEHKIALKNKCPNCRNTPFDTINDPQLYKDVLRMRVEQIQKDTVPLDCQFKKCEFTGRYTQFVEHYYKVHGVKATTLHIGCILKDQDKQQAQEFHQKFKQNKQPSYGTKKDCTPQQKQLMLEHVNQCNNEKCTNVWHGPWGPFIGGAQGRTHFDLTECQIGKQLNQNINWNYDNPAY